MQLVPDLLRLWRLRRRRVLCPPVRYLSRGGTSGRFVIRPVPGASDVHQAASERQTEYNTVLENPPTATENEVDNLLLAASQAYEAEESERQTEEPPTATENEEHSAMIFCLELRKPIYEAEEASERQTEEPPTATENGERSAMISCLELRKPCYVTKTTGVLTLVRLREVSA